MSKRDPKKNLKKRQALNTKAMRAVESLFDFADDTGYRTIIVDEDHMTCLMDISQKDINSTIPILNAVLLQFGCYVTERPNRMFEFGGKIKGDTITLIM